MWGLEDDIKIFLWTDIGYLPSIRERKNTVFFPGKSNDLLERGLSAIYNQNYFTKYHNLWIGASHGKFGRYITLEDYLTTIYEYNNVPGRHNSYKFRNDKILIERQERTEAIGGLTSQFATLLNTVNALDTKVNTYENRITALETTVNNNNTNLNSIVNRLNSIEEVLNTLIDFGAYDE